MENLGQRLLALNDLNCSLIGRDGHIWIEENGVDSDGAFVSSLSKILKGDIFE